MRWFAAGSIALVSALAIGATEDVSAGTAAERRSSERRRRRRHDRARRRPSCPAPPDRHAGAGDRRVLLAGRGSRAPAPPPGRPTVTLEADERLDHVDAYGRLLRYVHRGGANLNLELVRRGAATVWLYRGERGRYAAQLLVAAQTARRAHRGLWGACPNAVWNPLGPATTGGGGRADTSARHRRRRLRSVLPDRLHPVPAAGSRLRGHRVQALPCRAARPASLRRRGRRDRLRALRVSPLRPTWRPSGAFAAAPRQAPRARRPARCRRPRTRA